MDIQKYIRIKSLKKSTVLKNYFTGMEGRLFHTEDDYHIKNILKTNKKGFREVVYMFIYYIVVFFSIYVIGSLISGKFSVLICLILFSPLYIKPIVHYLALENKTKKKNIEIYKSFYNNTSIDTAVFNDSWSLIGSLILLFFGVPFLISTITISPSDKSDKTVSVPKKETIISNKKYINKTKVKKNSITEREIIDVKKNIPLEEKILLTISVDNLRVRTSPNLDAKKIENLKIGSQVILIAKSKNQSTVTINKNKITEYWYKVKTPSNNIGWIHGCCFDK